MKSKFLSVAVALVSLGFYCQSAEACGGAARARGHLRIFARHAAAVNLRTPFYFAPAASVPVPMPSTGKLTVPAGDTDARLAAVEKKIADGGRALLFTPDNKQGSPVPVPAVAAGPVVLKAAPVALGVDSSPVLAGAGNYRSRQVTRFSARSGAAVAGVVFRPVRAVVAGILPGGGCAGGVLQSVE